MIQLQEPFTPHLHFLQSGVSLQTGFKMCLYELYFACQRALWCVLVCIWLRVSSPFQPSQLASKAVCRLIEGEQSASTMPLHSKSCSAEPSGGSRCCLAPQGSQHWIWIYAAQWKNRWKRRKHHVPRLALVTWFHWSDTEAFERASVISAVQV